MAQNPFLSSLFDQQDETPSADKYALPGIKQEQPGAKPSASTNYLPPEDVRPIFETAAKEFNVPVNVLMALGHQESRYNASAIGQPTQWGRAKGMMQYLDSTAKGMGINPFAPEEAIPAAAKQIRERLDKGYSMEDAVKEHFAGPDRKLWGQKTQAYGREVMEKVGRIGEMLGTSMPTATQARSVVDELNTAEPGRYRAPTAEELDAFEKSQTQATKPTQAEADNQGFFDRAGKALSGGYDNMVQSLNTARFVMAGGDSAELAKNLASKFANEQNKPKTSGEQEIDKAFQEVTDAKGVWETTKAGAKAIGTAISNPKDLAVGIAEQAPNMLPTLGAGVAGAAGGAGIGAIGGLPGAIGGAVIGGRAGMAAGTTATELGAEVEQMVLERLESGKQAPTAQNIKTLLDDAQFQTEARNRGLAKGLTVATIDQIFLGLGGKVAGKAATASTKTGKVGYAAGAVGLDAVGETTGEAASQLIARGKVNKGEALQEGVYSLGSSMVEPAIGAGMQAAKRAGQAMRPQPAAPTPAEQAQAVAAENNIPNIVIEGTEDGQQVATVTPAQPSKAAGPLTRAIENAADQPERVTVTAPEGQITGFLQSTTQDSQGNTLTRVLGDDGQVYNFTSADNVQIKPEIGPLTSSVEKATDQTPFLAPETTAAAGTEEVLQQKATEQAAKEAAKPAETKTERPAEAIDVTGRTDKQLEYLAQNGQPGWREAAQAELAKRTAEPAKAPEPTLETMTEPELRARMKYIANQAKTAGGWNKMLMAERKKVEAQINKLAKQETTNDGRNAADLPVRDDQPAVAPVAAAQQADQQGAGEGGAAPVGAGAAVPATPVPGAGANVSGADSTADAKPALDAHAGKWFGSREKADAYIAKKNIAATHAVVQTGKVRFEVKPKSETPATSERQTKIDTVLNNGGKVVDGELRQQNGLGILKLTDAELAAIPDDKKDTTEAIKARLNAVYGKEKTNGAQAAETVETQAQEPQAPDAGAGKAVTEKPQAFEHSGYRVYPIKVRNGDQVENSWAVQTQDNKDRAARGEREVGGDAILPTVEEAKAQAEFQAKQFEQDQQREAQDAEIKAAEQAKKDAIKEDTINGFLDGKAENQKALIRKALDKQYRFNGKVMSVRERIESLFADGKLEVSTFEEPKIKPMSRTAFNRATSAQQAAHEKKMREAGTKTEYTVNGSLLGKTAYDYAAHLLDKEAKPATKIEKAPTAAILSNEGTRNDTEPTQNDAGTEAQGQQPGFVLEAESGEPSGRSAATDNRADGGVARGRAQPGNRGSDNAGQSGVRQRSDAADADAQQPVQSGRGSGAATGNRGTGRPRSGVGNYRIAQGELTREGSWKATAERNVEIVELVKQITSENRQATQEERAKLVKFTGWGASEIANGVFPDRYGRYKDASWQALGERLKAAMTEEEYAQAKRTTQYAHYTSDPIIRLIYEGLGRMGFAGGSILEPGMGIGHFAGLMPDGIAANSQYTGIEYDTLTGTIAKLLYPESNIIIGDYTRTNLPREFFDVGIGNPPFSSTQILSDPEYKSFRPMLHDYFFMKTIDRIRRAGLQIFVTSKGTMDKTSDKSRKYLAKNAILLGAIRLPQTAFKENAGTEVVTDIIFLQKRGDGVEDNGVQWMNTKEIQTPDGPAMINEYFADHPEMVLGKHALQGSMYRANEYTVLPPDGDIEQLFAKAIKNLPEDVFRPRTETKATIAAVQDRDFNPKHKKEGGLYLSDDGKLMQVENGSGVAVEFRTNAEGKQIALTPKQKKWLREYVSVRDALKQAQFDQLNDGDWEKSLKALNKAYDGFVKENGQILEYSVIERTNKETGQVTETKRFKNDPLLRMDAEGALAYALETLNEDGTISKGAVLNQRVLQRPQEPEIKTTQDALFVSLNRNGSLNLDDVAALAGTDKDSVITDLGTSIYDAPGTGWQLADEYLSGNVVRKLKEAQSAAEINSAYKRNVEALLAVQPRPLGPTDITVRLGANWVPASDIEKFANEVLGDSMDIKYNPILNKWDVDQRTRSVSEWGFDKAQAGGILDAILNNRQLKITWRDSEGKTHPDLEATEKANDIAGKMRDRFKSWVWTDPKRAERLVNYYNENFNNIAPRQFDGSHLTLPGVSSRFKLYPHQKRAVWRIVQQGDTYLAHAVGAGKTMEMIAGGMEERRLGLIKKPMYVVPNHMLAQFSSEFLELYPTANIMVADEHNFHSSNRKRFVAQAALNNPDAIVITHSAFGRIGMSDAYYQEFITKQIDDWKEALDDVDKGDRITRKQIERRIEQLEQRLEGRQNKDKKDQVLTFEELGVDKLFVDEFHEFRKLDFASNQGNVKGVDSNGSQRALDLYMKVEYLRSKNPTRALVAASGTPVTNTMGELFTAQRFFQPKQLEEDGTSSFDAWAAQFGDIVTGFEQNAAGGYEMVARFAKFQNVPELMRRVRSFMDILTSSNLGELVKRPDVIGGGREVEVTPVPEGYKEYQQQLQNRIKTIKNRKGPPKKGEDIILKVIGDGRFSAIDMRFVNPDAPSDPNNKLNTAITRMIDAYNETKGYEYAGKDGKAEPIKGSSIILFTDIGLGEQSAASRGFDMRAWIEKRLTDAGIPRDQIAFMRDHKQHAKKERLFADMRSGKKRILIGGKEMETGTNVQKRLSHLFHLDAPWFPASVEQREGRIIRQGNQNKEVKVTAFATKGSYDSTMWGMNARKARFIEQAMNGDDSVRSLDDVSEASAFEMAAALASGDERYLKLAGLKADVERLERLRQAHYDDQNKLTRDKHWAEESVKRNNGRMKDIEAAIAKRQPIRAGEFSAKVGTKTYDSREEFGQAIFKQFQTLAGDSTMGDKQLGEIGGFPIKFYGIKMQGSGGYSAALHVEIPDSDPLLTYPLDPSVAVGGIATRAANQVNGLDRQLMEIKQQVQQSNARIEQIGKRLGSTFPEESLLLEKVAELNALETELAAENDAANAEAVAATQEVEGDKPAEDEGAKFSVAAMRDETELEAIFADLEKRGLARNRAERMLNSDPDQAIIRYVDQNFFDILEELDDSKKVVIKC